MWLKSHGGIDQPPNHTQFRCDMNIVQRTINSYFDNHKVGFTLPFINAFHQEAQSLDNISRCPMRPNESWHFWVGDLIKSAFLLGDMFLDSPWYVHNNHMKNWSFISMPAKKLFVSVMISLPLYFAIYFTCAARNLINDHFQGRL